MKKLIAAFLLIALSGIGVLYAPAAFSQSSGTFNTLQVRKQTYGTTVAALTLASTPTDAITIVGAANTVVKLREISCWGTETTHGIVAFSLIKRSAVDTGGTATQPTIAPFNAQNNAAKAVVNAYTVSPTGLGTALGTIRYTMGFFEITAGTVASVPVTWPFTLDEAQQPTLNGATENLAINFGGATLTGGVVNCYLEWTEN